MSDKPTAVTVILPAITKRLARATRVFVNGTEIPAKSISANAVSDSVEWPPTSITSELFDVTIALGHCTVLVKRDKPAARKK